MAGVEAPGTATIVGTGIRVASQLTLEARQAIETADKLFHLASDEILETYLARINPTAESLLQAVKSRSSRSRAYREMMTEVLRWVRSGAHVCVACYGHPGVLVDISRLITVAAKQEGFGCRILPGISALDCLYAEVGLDPGRDGCMEYDATDFLVYRRVFSVETPLVLMQPGYAGNLTITPEASPIALELLAERLGSAYGYNHDIVIYEASPYNVAPSKIIPCRISDLPETSIGPAATLYIPPLRKAVPARDILLRLRLPIPD